MKTLLIQDAVCCRKWPVVAFAQVGPCGLCGQRPVVIGNPRTIQVPDDPRHLLPYFKEYRPR